MNNVFDRHEPTKKKNQFPEHSLHMGEGVKTYY